MATTKPLIVGFNGAPRSYKTTRIEETIALLPGIPSASFSFVTPFIRPWMDIASQLTGEEYGPEDYESLKDKRVAYHEGGAVTGRDLLISMIEGIKSELPNLPVELMVRLISSLSTKYDVIFLQNVGFETELRCIESAFPGQLIMVYMEEKRNIKLEGYMTGARFHDDSRVCLRGYCHFTDPSPRILANYIENYLSRSSAS